MPDRAVALQKMFLLSGVAARTDGDAADTIDEGKTPDASGNIAEAADVGTA